MILGTIVINFWCTVSKFLFKTVLNCCSVNLSKIVFCQNFLESKTFSNTICQTVRRFSQNCWGTTLIFFIEQTYFICDLKLWHLSVKKIIISCICGSFFVWIFKTLGTLTQICTRWSENCEFWWENEIGQNS